MSLIGCEHIQSGLGSLSSFQFNLKENLTECAKCIRLVVGEYNVSKAVFYGVMC